VILVGDIDMGGVFAQFVGTLELIEPKDRKLIKAFLINKFRGNLKLLEPGLDWLASKTKRPVLGVVPFLADIDLAEEDSLSERDTQTQGLRANRLFDQVSGRKRDRRILVQNNDELLIDILWLPRVSNFTDFDLLVKSPGVRVRWLHEPDRHTQPDLIFIPGTKSTLADLNFLRRSGLADYIFKAARAGSWVFGICGGYQMLGESLEDPSGVESRQRHSAGLGLLPVQTVFSARKETHQISAVHLASGLEVRGYEVHMGRTRIIDGVKVKRLFKIAARSGKEQRDAFEGIDFKRAKSRIFGSYMHGLFQNRNFLEVFMGELRAARGLKSALFNTPALHGFGEDRLYDAVAEKVKKAIDMDFLLKIADI